MNNIYSKITIGFALTVMCGSLVSQNEQDEDENEDIEVTGSTRMIEIDVEATPIESTPGTTTYSAETIEKSPTGEGNLSDLLRLNPSVDFSRESNLSAGTASLRPDEISIHGQEFYQNLFLIDGSDATNDLNPANSMDVWRTPSLVAPHGGSSPQGYYIDVDLLEKVEVYDSNIPVEFGGFTGGVVSADLKSYDGEDKISFKWGLQKDEWESFHVSEDDITTADRYSAVYTPDYEKSNYKISVQRRLGDIGITLGITRRHSTFAQQFEDDTDTIRMLDYEDSIQNVVGKLSFALGGQPLTFSFRSTSRTHDGLTSTNYTGMFEKEHNGIGFTVGTSYEFGDGDMELTFSFDQLSDILDSSTSYFSYHEHLENSGMSRYEGAFGDSEQQQTRWSFKPKWTRPASDAAGFWGSHQLTMGGEIKTTTSFYKRPEDITFENFWCVRDMGREGCQDQDGDGVSSAGDEYLQSRSFWFAGEVEVSYEEISAYIEDKFSLNDFPVGDSETNVTVGVRADWESYLENFNISPRINVDRELFDGTIVAGLSRYYGRSFFRYELNDAIYGWREIFLNLTRPRGRPGEEVPCSDPDFVNCTHRTFDDRSGRSELDTPYSDEWMIGWSTTAFAIDTSVQFVSRESKKGVSRSRDDDGNYFYTNDGRSSTQSVSASFINSQPYLFGISETTFSLSVSYKNSESNRQDDGGYEDDLDQELIYYKGSLISAEELPAWDYNVPFGIGFFTTTRFPVWDITWTNFFNHRQGGTIARDTRENYMDPDTGMSHDIYEDFEFDGLLTVNSKISWNGRISDRFSGFVNFEVNNLFDEVVDKSRFDTRRRFTQGRRFWIEVGVDFR